MLFVLDLDSQKIVTSAGSQAEASSVTGKRGPVGVIAIQVVSSGVAAVAAVSGLELKFTAKALNNFDDDALATTEVFTWNATALQYRGAVSWITTALDTLFAANGDGSDDVAEISLGVELGWRTSPTDDWSLSENQVTLTLANNYIRDTDGSPASSGSNPNRDWLPRVPFTDYTGGAAGALDAFVTDDVVDTGALAFTVVSSVARMWQLVAGTDAENEAGGIIRPDDYHATNNARVWKQIAWQ